MECGGVLVAVCTFGKPASPSLCDGICGKEHSKSVYELNRLCRVEDLTEPLSEFVSACLRRLRCENWIIVSYSDTGMHHNGYIYQACNFMYTGTTKQRTDKYVPMVNTVDTIQMRNRESIVLFGLQKIDMFTLHLF